MSTSALCVTGGSRAGLAPPTCSVPPPPPHRREGGERSPRGHRAGWASLLPGSWLEGRAEGSPGAAHTTTARTRALSPLRPFHRAAHIRTAWQLASALSKPPKRPRHAAVISSTFGLTQGSSDHCARTTEGRALPGGRIMCAWAVMEAADRGPLAGSAAGRAGRGRAPEEEELEGPKSLAHSPTLPWTQAREDSTGLCG